MIIYEREFLRDLQHVRRRGEREMGETAVGRKEKVAFCTSAFLPFFLLPLPMFLLPHTHIHTQFQQTLFEFCG